MKALFMILMSTILLPEQVMARPRAEKPDPLPGVVKREPSVPCEKVAWDVAGFLDSIGWGKVKGYIPRTIAHDREDNGLSFQVRIEDENKESISGYTYTVSIIRDQKSQFCIVLSVTTD
jgi:hypothetical protein